jgi:protein-S-isoprenylcysteine O-methyltransferase Ste14
LLIVSIYYVTASFYYITKVGGSKNRKNKSANFKFEDTANLVKTGVYKYIRHPMYSSLLFLSLGAMFKNLTFITLLLEILILVFLYLTAKFEEKENVEFFGDAYTEYMKETKMFIPFIF